MRRNLEFSTRLTTTNWTLQVLQDLKSVEKSDDVNSYSAMGLVWALSHGIEIWFRTCGYFVSENHTVMHTVD